MLRDLQFPHYQIECFRHAGQFGFAVFKRVEEQAAFGAGGGDDFPQLLALMGAILIGAGGFFRLGDVQFPAQSARFGQRGQCLLFQRLDFPFQHGAGLLVAVQPLPEDHGVVAGFLRRGRGGGLTSRFPHGVDFIQQTAFIPPVFAQSPIGPGRRLIVHRHAFHLDVVGSAVLVQGESLALKMYRQNFVLA